MTILWFWTFLIAASFGLATYQQAAEPGWKLGLAAIVVAVLALCYMHFGFPDEMFRSVAEFDRHPDRLRIQAAGWTAIAAAVCLAGIAVGHVLRRLASPTKLGLWAFVFAFVGMNVFATFVITGAFT